MFVKIITCFVLVSALPCDSQRQKFVAAPLEESRQTSPSPMRFDQRLDRAHAGTPTINPFSGVSNSFTSNHNTLQRNFNSQRNINNRLSSNVPSQRQQFVGSGFVTNQAGFGSIQPITEVNGNEAQLHPTRKTPIRTLRRRPTTTTIPPPAVPSSFTNNQPTSSFSFGQDVLRPATPLQNRFAEVNQLSRPPQEGLLISEANRQFLDSVEQPKSSPRPTNAFLSIEEPVLRSTVQATQALEGIRDSSGFSSPAQFTGLTVSSSQPALQIKSPDNIQNNHRFGLNPRRQEKSQFFINAEPSVTITPQRQEFHRQQPHTITSQVFPIPREFHTQQPQVIAPQPSTIRQQFHLQEQNIRTPQPFPNFQGIQREQSQAFASLQELQTEQPIVRIPQVFPSRQELQTEQPIVRIPQGFPSHQEFLGEHRNIKVPTQAIHNRQKPQTNVEIQSETDSELEELLFKQQAENAKYSFASQIDDSIYGNQHQREEVRDGLAVKGMYSYSDGYVKRTVHYEADEKGYRVVKEEEEPLGEGPQVDPNGHADVSTFVAGNTLQYSITAADIQELNNKQKLNNRSI